MSDSIITKFVADIITERSRQFDLPGTECDVEKNPNDWLLTVIGILCEAQSRYGVNVPEHEFENSLVKAGAVMIAALEHVELMKQKGKL